MSRFCGAALSSDLVSIKFKSPQTGREVDWFKIGFAPRKANFSLYLSMNINQHQETLARLGKHKTGAGCLYINKLADVDMDVLEGMIKEGAGRFGKF